MDIKDIIVNIIYLQTPEDKFHTEVFQDYLKETLDNNIKELISKEYNLAKDALPFTCKISWENYDDIHATLSKCNNLPDYYYIKLYTGYLTKLIDKTVSIYQSIPNKTKVHIDSIDNYNILLLDKEQFNPEIIMIIYFLYLFTITHEIGHIVLGHAKGPREKGYIQQAKEYYADKYSFEKMLITNNNNNFESISILLESFYVFATIYKKGQSLIRYNGIKFTHPHPFIRFYYMKDWLLTEIEKNTFNISEEEKKKIIDKSEELFTNLHINYIEKKIYDKKFEETEFNNIKNELENVDKLYCNLRYDKPMSTNEENKKGSV